MNCDQGRKLLALYTGGDLDAAETARVDRHLEDCAECRKFCEGLESNHNLLRSFRQETAPSAALAKMRTSLLHQLANPAAVIGWRIRLERFFLAGFQSPRYAVAGIAMAAIISVTLFAQMRHVAAGPVVMAAVFEGDDTLLRPDFRTWQVVDATTHVEQHEFGKVYISPAAYKEFSQSGKFPEGTVMILEPRQNSGSLLASVKDSSRFDEGWGYFEFRDVESRQTSKASALPKTAGCMGCHRNHAAFDHVFTQFYPVLRTAAGML